MKTFKNDFIKKYEWLFCLGSLTSLFLNRAGVPVCCQICASKACFARAADLSFTEIHVDALASTSIIRLHGWSGGRCWSCVRHQPPGKQL